MPIPNVARARTGHAAKERASAALADMGISISDAIRLLMVGAGDRLSPVEATPSSAITSRAVVGLEDRQAWAFARIADFLADLRNEGD
jgi:DNA-damage-inducible protein J